MQGWERAINTLSVRRPQPHNTNPYTTFYCCMPILQIGKIYIFILREQHVHGLNCIDADFI